MNVEVGAYVTIITAIIAAFLAYRYQIRLKAFELFLARRDSVLKDVENFIEKLYKIQDELDSSNIESATFTRYKKECFHEGLIIYHKVKGANFGEAVPIMIESFWSIISEAENNNPTMNHKEWIQRTLNILSPLYGFAHSQVTKEMEGVAFSFVEKLKRKYSSRLKIEEKD